MYRKATGLVNGKILNSTYQKNQIVNLDPVGLVVKVYDFTILNCKKKNIDKAIATVTQDVIDAANQQPFISRDIAGYYSMIGHMDEALSWVENAINMGYINYPFLAFHHPFYENVRKEPRFKELLDKVKPKWESFKI